MKSDIKNIIMKRVKNIHFIGIGGSGMSGIASILKDLGYKVSGSDISSSKVTDNLKKQDIKISIGHQKDNILSKDVVVISSAIDNLFKISSSNCKTSLIFLIANVPMTIISKPFLSFSSIAF